MSGQSRGHLFKGSVTWKQEIRLLWKRVAEASVDRNEEEKAMRRRYRGRKGFLLGTVGFASLGNTSVKKLLADSRFVGAVLDFPRITDVGRLKSDVL